MQLPRLAQPELADQRAAEVSLPAAGEASGCIRTTWDKTRDLMTLAYPSAVLFDWKWCNSMQASSAFREAKRSRRSALAMVQYWITPHRTFRVMPSTAVDAGAEQAASCRTFQHATLASSILEAHHAPNLQKPNLADLISREKRPQKK